MPDAERFGFAQCKLAEATVVKNFLKDLPQRT